MYNPLNWPFYAKDWIVATWRRLACAVTGHDVRTQSNQSVDGYIVSYCYCARCKTYQGPNPALKV